MVKTWWEDALKQSEWTNINKPIDDIYCREKIIWDDQWIVVADSSSGRSTAQFKPA